MYDISMCNIWLPFDTSFVEKVIDIKNNYFNEFYLIKAF